MRGSAHRFGSFSPFMQRKGIDLSFPLLYRIEQHVP
jgi:hypothetical protein